MSSACAPWSGARDSPTTIAIPGGRPKVGPGIYSLDDLTDDALAILDGYGVERASVVGLSMGGYIAQLVAARHAQRVDKLVLLSTTADHRPYMAATTATRRRCRTPSFAARRRVHCERDRGGGLPIPADREEAEQTRWRSGGASMPRRMPDYHAFPADFILIACAGPVPADTNFQPCRSRTASPPRPRPAGRDRAPTLVIHGRYDPRLPLDHGSTCQPYSRCD